MSALVYRVAHLLCRVVQGLPTGTNLGLLHLLWAIVSGRLLGSRGAVIPALAEMGLPDGAVRRSWAALAYGKWDCRRLLARWQRVALSEGHWRAHFHGGYRPIACDLVGFFRPRLRGCPSRHYSSSAGKALPAIVLGVLASVGSVKERRLPLLRALVRARPGDGSEADVQGRLLREAREMLANDEALACDRGFPVSQIQAAGVERYVARVAKNFTARRAAVAPYRGRGRPPRRGEIVRPLPRTYRGRAIAATPADREETWLAGSLLHPIPLRALFWEGLVLPDAAPGAPTFSCALIHDPRYAEPLVLCTTLPLSGQELRAFYEDRWAIEQLPLAAKQMLGGARQFVFSEESRQRLPELSLLSGAVLMYAAATQEAVAAGFWDRRPQPTCGRLRRALARARFTDIVALPEHVRKKRSPTAHLPTGVSGHRRRKPSEALSTGLRRAA